MQEGEVRIALILRGPHDVEINLEPVPQRLIPWDAVGSCLACGEKVEHREEETGFVGSFMPEGTFAHDTDMQTVEGFDRDLDSGQSSGLRSGHVRERGARPSVSIHRRRDDWSSMLRPS
jgi:hypothetical protein